MLFLSKRNDHTLLKETPLWHSTLGDFPKSADPQIFICEICEICGLRIKRSPDPQLTGVAPADGTGVK
jgi:hypothetical protein